MGTGRLPFPSFRPDLSDQQQQWSRTIQNVVPQGDGYGPFKDFLALTSAATIPVDPVTSVPGYARGAFFARNTDGTVAIFAGTATRLYKLNNSTLTWQDVSHSTATFGAITPGNGYTDGTYTNVPLTGGSGTGITADIVVTAGAVTFVGLGPPSGPAVAVNAGINYVAGDVLHVASPGPIGSGANFAIPIAAAGYKTLQPYLALGTDRNWQFVQFNNLVLATQGSDFVQAYDLTQASNPGPFYNLGGNPPRAAFMEVVSRFVMLSGLTDFPYQINWSDLDNPTTWTAGFGQADFQRLPDGGQPKDIAGFDLYGVVFQDNLARLITYSPGSPVVFTITKITGGDGNGIFAPYSVVIDQDNIFWCSQEGFKMLPPGGAPVAIGKEYVDRFFFGNAYGSSGVDTSNLQLAIATSDPVAARVYFAYKSFDGTGNFFDTVLCFDWKLKEWTVLKIQGEWMFAIARPGKTEESLDNASPGAVAVTAAASGTGGVIRLTVSNTSGLVEGNTYYVTQVVGTAPFLAAINKDSANVLTGLSYGIWPVHIVDSTHIELTGSVFAGAYTSGGIVGANVELLTSPMDSISTATLPGMAMIDSTNTIGVFAGPNLEAQLETSEQGGDEKRMLINGIRAITDATTVFGSVSYRENPQAAYNYTAESVNNQLGICPQRIETRYSRGRLRIPYGTTWTYANGVEAIDVRQTGSR